MYSILILHIAVDIGRHSLLFHSFISRFLKVVLRKKGEQILIIQQSLSFSWHFSKQFENPFIQKSKICLSLKFNYHQYVVYKFSALKIVLKKECLQHNSGMQCLTERIGSLQQQKYCRCRLYFEKINNCTKANNNYIIINIFFIFM